jgi:hypothetical protein
MNQEQEWAKEFDKEFYIFKIGGTMKFTSGGFTATDDALNFGNKIKSFIQSAISHAVEAEDNRIVEWAKNEIHKSVEEMGAGMTMAGKTWIALDDLLDFINKGK